MKKQTRHLFIEKKSTIAFYSNLEFNLDSFNYSIEYAELGESKEIPGGYSWDTPYGRLEQVGGVLKLIELSELPELYKRIEI